MIFKKTLNKSSLIGDIARTAVRALNLLAILQLLMNRHCWQQGRFLRKKVLCYVLRTIVVSIFMLNEKCCYSKLIHLYSFSIFNIKPNHCGIIGYTKNAVKNFVAPLVVGEIYFVNLETHKKLEPDCFPLVHFSNMFLSFFDCQIACLCRRTDATSYCCSWR